MFVAWIVACARMFVSCMCPQPLTMHRHRRSKPQFLAKLPSGNLWEWVENRVVNPGEDRCSGTIRLRVHDLFSTSDTHSVDSCVRRADARKRSDMPVVRAPNKGDPAKVRRIAMDRSLRMQAQQELEDDMYALTTRAPREARLATWQKFHVWWFGEDVPMLPLTVSKICRVSALFKAGSYKSYKNYISTIKDHHIAEGFPWDDQLWRITQKCTKSVLRGLPGPSRSEPFDVLDVAKFLESRKGPLSNTGPTNPLAMVVCATYFMMRELEVSAIEMEDVVFTESSVSINLPVSKVDWSAKGCRRTWSCICDKGYPCPVHILKEHDVSLRRSGKQDGPWFPDRYGRYCTKEGVVETIRRAVHESGGMAKDCSDMWIISGHTFRITGARTLSAWGLDPVTIQLLGRWGSMAVLSYLADSPLIGFSDRLHSTASSSTANLGDGSACRNLADYVASAPSVDTGHLHKEQELMKQNLLKLSRQLEDVKDNLEGVTGVLEENHSIELWTVVNDISKVSHKATIDLSNSPSRWRTICGWQFAGRRYATTYRQQYSNSSFRPCSKCHHLRREDSSDSDGSSTSCHGDS